MTTLTIALEIVLAVIGATIAIGAPLIGIYLHHHQDATTGGPALVRVGRLVDDDWSADSRVLAAA